MIKFDKLDRSLFPAGVTGSVDENKTKAECSCVLRFFGADEAALRQAVLALAGASAQCASRGAETLVALRTQDKPALQRAEKRLRVAFPNDYYGRGEQNLAAATVAALENRDCLLACADAYTGAMLEPRLEGVEGAARVFDFGAMSYAEPRARAEIERLASRKKTNNAAQRELARVKATLRVAGAEIAAACMRRPDGALLLVGARRGCWLRAVRADENAALWLIDMVRRAACGLKQAEGTRWQKYGGRVRMPEQQAQSAPENAAAPQSPAEQNARKPAAAAVAAPAQRKHGHALRGVLTLLLLLALAGLAGAWYTTGGDLAALPEMLGFSQQLHSGAQRV